MYAVIRAGGKQLRVEPGDLVSIERTAGAPGDRIELSEVLLVGGDELQVGAPCVPGARVVATVQEASKGPKIHIFKYKRRKRYRLRQGHRQNYTTIRIESIEA